MCFLLPFSVLSTGVKFSFKFSFLLFEIENGPGATVASLGISSPSKQTFKLLNTSFTAADQVPNESLHLSHSYNSDQLDANAEAAPKLPGSRGGAFKRSGANSAQQQQQQQVDSKPGGGGDGGMAAFSPRPGVTFSLELNLPDSKDHSFPTGNQLQRSEEYPGGGATPQRGAGEVIHTPSSVGSHALSEFSFVHEEDARPGAAYISSPGHSRSHGDGGSDGDHSLSRSLSASFGQVSSDKFTDDYHHSGGRREEKALSPVAESPASGRRSSRYPDDYSSVQGSSARSGGGALNPSMLAQYAKQMQNPLDEDSEDSVEGLELSYGGGDAAVGSVKGFRIHGTVQAAQRAERAAVVVGQAMAAVEQRFRTGTCSVSGFIASALAADVRNFDKVSFKVDSFATHGCWK